MKSDAKPPSERTLDGDIPELREYLRPGATVLDVGCGKGTITLDVAAAIKPGKVIGLDPDEQQVDVVRNWLAQQPAVDNVSFQMGDSHALDFSDGTFDLVYSHTVIHFFLDPVDTLKEQARVTKPGGWVVVSGVREWAYSVRNPPCPNWDRYMEARELHSEAWLKDFRSSGLRPADYIRQKMANSLTHMDYMDFHGGKKCAGWLVDAGLKDLKIGIKAERVRYHGAPDMEPGTIWDLLPVDAPETPLERELVVTARTMIANGLLDASTLERAKDEIRVWYGNPRALFFNILVFAAGRKA